MTDWTALRSMVREAAAEGRATYLPAGARSNPTALVLVDGLVVGEAASLMHLVRHDMETYSQWGESKLLPA